jgi:hypothetical protein
VRWCGTGHRKVEVDGTVYQVRAQSKEDGRVQVQVKVREGGEAVGELLMPAGHLAALARAVGEVARTFGFGRKPIKLRD